MKEHLNAPRGEDLMGWLSFRLCPILMGVLLVYSISAPKPRSIAPSEHGKAAIIRVGYRPLVGALPLFVAKDKKLDVRRGQKWEMVQFATSEQLLEAAALGRIDAGWASLSEILALHLVRPGLLKLVSVTSSTQGHDPTAFLVKSNTSIKSVEELKGKTIGVLPGKTMRVLAKLVLKKYGLEEQVRFVELSPHLQLQALSTGQVDALFAIEPTVTVAITKGIGKVILKDPLVNHIMVGMPGAAIFITDRFYRERRKEAKKFVRVIADSLDFIGKNETQARRSLTAFVQLSQGVVEKMRFSHFLKPEAINWERLQLYADLLWQNGALEGKVNVGGLRLK